MKCPECNGIMKAHHVTHTQDNHVKRRRVCLSCKHRFTTIEVPLDEFRVMRAKDTFFSLLLEEKEATPE